MDESSEARYRELEPRFTNTTREKLGVLAISRPPRTLIDRVLALDAPTADTADILEDLGITDYGVPSTVLKPVVDGSRIAGPAVTVLNESGSSDRWPYEFTDIFLIAEPGDVVVIAGEGFAQAGSWGGTTTGFAVERGLAGTVSQWPCRDWNEIQEKEYPVWTPGFTPFPTKRHLMTKALMVPIKIHGTTVRPGDLVVADAGGVIFAPQEQLGELERRLRAEAN